MTDLNSTLQVVLQESGYRTSLVTLDGVVAVCFEDEAAMGFACVLENVTTLLEKWQTIEIGLLRRYAPRLQDAGDKSWNVYCIFLCAAPATEVEQRELNRIEENLERTRKIAACGLSGHEDLVEVLLPVLPLQYKPARSTEDLSERLRKRIAAISPAASTVARDEKVSS